MNQVSCVLRLRPATWIGDRLFKGAYMNNFNYLLGAWIAVWAVFCFYQISIARRVAQLRDEVERLKQKVH